MKALFYSTAIGILTVTSGCHESRNPVPTKDSLNIGHAITHSSKVLNETRQLNICLPPAYRADDTSHYPVVYLLDGGMDEDFLHVTGLYQISSSEWTHRVKPSIVVGICNIDRVRDFTFPSGFKDEREKFPSSGHSGKFMEYVEKELIPFIDSHYRTNKDRTLIGESLGGLMATQFLLNKINLFNRYVIISPSLWWNDGSLFLSEGFGHMDSRAQKGTQIFIGVGKEGPNDGPRPHIMEVDAKKLYDIIQSKQMNNIQSHFKMFEEENHSTVGHIALYTAIKTFDHSWDNYKND